MLTRQVAEHGLGLPDTGFYRWVATKAEPVPHPGYWARDAQKSMRHLGWGVALANIVPGAIVCNSRVSKPYGHIGIYMGTVTVTDAKGVRRVLTDVVLENTDSSRGYRLGGAVALTDLGRFDPDEVFVVPNVLPTAAQAAAIIRKSLAAQAAASK